MSSHRLEISVRNWSHKTILTFNTYKANWYFLFQKIAGWHMHNWFGDWPMDCKILPCEFIYRYTPTHTFLRILGQYVQYMSYFPRQTSLKDAVLNQFWILFPSSSLETSGTPCAANHLSHVPKPICSLEADLPFAEIVRFLHVLLMGKSVLLRSIQNFNRYFLFWKNI